MFDLRGRQYFAEVPTIRRHGGIEFFKDCLLVLEVRFGQTFKLPQQSGRLSRALTWIAGEAYLVYQVDHLTMLCIQALVAHRKGLAPCQRLGHIVSPKVLAGCEFPHPVRTFTCRL